MAKRPHMQAVWYCTEDAISVGGSHENTYWRETPCVQCLQQAVLPDVEHEKTLETCSLTTLMASMIIIGAWLRGSVLNCLPLSHCTLGFILWLTVEACFILYLIA